VHPASRADVYSDKKETFLREAEGYEAIYRLRAQAAATAEDDDMFADDDTVPSGERAGSASNGGSAEGGGAAAGGGVPSEASGFVFDEASG
jgi:hypothetical protein